MVQYYNSKLVLKSSMNAMNSEMQCLLSTPAVAKPVIPQISLSNAQSGLVYLRTTTLVGDQDPRPPHTFSSSPVVLSFPSVPFLPLPSAYPCLSEQETDPL